MRELGAMWRNTRMVVLCAISAALYAAVLVPFKVVPLIPGVTELRPANAIPIVCSFLFGPAAGWGSAIGNMIGDFFGGVGPGDIFGFFANLAVRLHPLQGLERDRPGPESDYALARRDRQIRGRMPRRQRALRRYRRMGRQPARRCGPSASWAT